jgi:amidase
MPEAGDVCRLSASEAVRLQRRGAISAEELVRACLRRIEEREPAVAAWEYLDPALAIAQARACDRLRRDGGEGGPLHGVPVGIKDICDTADMPTTYGSRAHLGHRPTIDAVCVTQTREAGGIVMGKTVTTEFAGRYPGKTSNPHDCRRTPGGSSSGSAAAVADFMVPLAIGTQTGGSVVRPASYCGVFGFKPTFGHLSFEGVHHGAETFDTLGIMARTLDDIGLYHAVLLGLKSPLASPAGSTTPPRIGFCRTFRWGDIESSNQAAIAGAASTLASCGATVSELVLPDAFAEIYDLASRLFAVEYSRALAPERRQSPENLSRAMVAILDGAATVSAQEHAADLQRLDELKVLINPVLAEFDLVLTPTADGEAPMGHESTGPMTFSILWQALGLPCLTMPALTGLNGLPIGLQIVGQRHHDLGLLARADWIWRALASGDGRPGA